jgi:hypothetical protein
MNKMTRLAAWALVGAAATTWTVAASAADWGSLKGHFVVDGQPPKLADVDPGTDPVCCEHHPASEAVVVGKNGGLANVVVYVYLGHGQSIDVHPDYAVANDQPVVLNNEGCAFHPHVCLVRTGQPFVIENSDPTGHSTHARLQRNGAFNVQLPVGAEVQKIFGRAESRPLPVTCDVHPFMRGYLLVRDDPYMAVSAGGGTFEIANLPAGRHTFQFWHEVPGFLKNIELGAGKLDRRGRIELTIPAGGTLDLGEIKISAEMLQP